MRISISPPRPCARTVLAVFGLLFLITLFSVPVTTRTSQDRRDPVSNVVIRTTYPRKATMFLPVYLSAQARARGTGALRIRSTPWVGTMVIVVALGIFDYIVFCRLLRRRQPREPGPDRDPADGGSRPDPDPSGLF